MSGLPEIIQVKRKRDQDAAVDFICFDEFASKRHRGENSQGTYIYQRQRRTKESDVESAESVNSSQSESQSVPAFAPPPIQVSKAGDENRPIKALKKKRSVDPSSLQVEAEPVTPTGPARVLLSDDMRHARRFHLSRHAEPASGSGFRGPDTSRKRKNALFVERGIVKKPKQSPSPDAKINIDKHLRDGSNSKKIEAAIDAVEKVKSEEDSMDLDKTKPSADATATSSPRLVLPTRLKKPGVKSRVPSSAQHNIPPSFLDHEDEDMSRLANEMDAFALEVVKQELAAIDAQKEKEKARAAKFRPKGQAKGQRIFERDPEAVAQWDRELAERNRVAAGGDMDLDASDDDDYVTETYVRVPASCLTDEVAPQQIGLLVFDTEADEMEFFFGPEDPSSDEFLEDEDDENAEGHYTADYPDHDLDWDDELNQNPYNYRQRNASDLEEFDDRAFEDAFLNRAWDENGERTLEDKLIQASMPGLFHPVTDN